MQTNIAISHKEITEKVGEIFFFFFFKYINCISIHSYYISSFHDEWGADLAHGVIKNHEPGLMSNALNYFLFIQTIGFTAPCQL